MKVPDEILKCVAFIGAENKFGMPETVGTCFFVNRQSEKIADRGFYYTLTAKHIVSGIAHRGQDKVYVKVNFADRAEWIATDVKEWFDHPTDGSVDAVVNPFFELPDGTNQRPHPLHNAMTGEIAYEPKLGPGDEILIPGLFLEHHGRQRNIPIVRDGAIAAMRDEKVAIDIEGTIVESDVYLVDTRSIGGLSGSPVFVYIGGGVRDFAFSGGAMPRFWLLGMMQGHYYDLLARKLDGAENDDRVGRQINEGIGFVVPADRLLELIKQEKVAALDERLDLEYLQSRGEVAEDDTERKI